MRRTRWLFLAVILGILVSVGATYLKRKASLYSNAPAPVVYNSGYAYNNTPRRGPNGDYDRDGIPNKYDRDANGDGVPDRFQR